MATTQNAARLMAKDCKRLIKKYRSYYPDLSSSDVMERFAEEGVFDAGILLELVHEKEYGLKRDSRNGRDLSDGSNSKLSCSYSPLNGQHTAFGWRFKVKNVESDVIVRFSNPVNEEVYGGRIPYAEIKGKNYLVITDCVEGGVIGGRYGKYLTGKYGKYITKA